MIRYGFETSKSMKDKDEKMKAMDMPEKDKKMKAMDMPKKDDKMKMRAVMDPMAHGKPTAKEAIEEGKKLGLTTSTIIK